MHLFDCNCMLGPTNTGRERPFVGVNDLLAEMDRVGIEETLVHHSCAVQAHPEYGNQRLLDEIAGEPSLHPAWVLLPPGPQELGSTDRLIENMRVAGVRAAFMYPNLHKYSFTPNTLGELPAALEAAGIPIFVNTGRTHWSQITIDWDGVIAICRSHPGLHVTLLHEGGTTQRALFAQWPELPNLHLDTCYFQMPEPIAGVCNRFGAGSLLFGTNMPTTDPGGPIHTLWAADIDEATRAAVAGDNLRRMMGLAPKGAGSMGTWPCGAAGFRVFDIHGHLGRWETVHSPVGRPDEIVAAMDRIGIETIVVSDFVAIGPDFRDGNARTAAAVRQFPGRILGYGAYNPNYGDAMAEEMRRCLDEYGMVGLKVHCGQHDTRITDDRYRPAFAFANERGLPVLVHGNPPTEWLDSLLAEYPDMYFLLAHRGGRVIDEGDTIVALASQRPNLIFDLTASACHRGYLAWLVGGIGPDQICYGSDFPLMDFSYQLGRVLGADISDDDKRKILCHNAARIFRRG